MDKKINISWDILVKKVRWGLTPEEESAFQEELEKRKEAARKREENRSASGSR